MRQVFKSLNYRTQCGIFPVSVPLSQPEPLPRAYFDLTLDSSPIGRIVFQVYDKVAPRTARNFLSLSAGFKHSNGQTYSYKNTQFNRFIPMRGIWGGEIENGNFSIYGQKFSDETFAISHNKEGILTTANVGGPNSNDSRFIITLGPSQWLDKKSVAFGEVIQGLDLLKQLEKLGDKLGRTSKKVTVANSGLLDEQEYHRYDVQEKFDIWQSHPNH